MSLATLSLRRKREYSPSHLKNDNDKADKVHSRRYRILFLQLSDHRADKKDEYEVGSGLFIQVGWKGGFGNHRPRGPNLFGHEALTISRDRRAYGADEVHYF